MTERAELQQLQTGVVQERTMSGDSCGARRLRSVWRLGGPGPRGELDTFIHSPAPCCALKPSWHSSQQISHTTRSPRLPTFTLPTIWTYELTLGLLCSYESCSAGELNPDELERIVTIIQNPTQFKIPAWFLNRQKDWIDGKNGQLLSNQLDSKVRGEI